LGDLMAKGGYNGGSTVLGPGSSWLSRGKPKPKRRVIGARYTHLSEAELQERIEQAALRLERTQADFEAGRLVPAPPKPTPVKNGKKRKHKLKLAAQRAKKRSMK
jgi:hypothetical protein